MQRYLRVCAMVATAPFLSCAESENRTHSLVSLEEGSLHPNISHYDSRILGHRDDGLLVEAGGSEAWPSITFSSGDDAWDLRGYFRVKVDVTNLGSLPLFAGIRLDSKSAGQTNTPQHAQGFESIEPGQTMTISMRLSTEDWIFDEPLPLVGMRRAPGIELMNLAAVEKIQVFIGHADEPRTFLIQNLRAEGTVEIRPTEGFLPFVDRYGQNKHKEWPEKIRDDGDFAKVIRIEESDLSRNPGISSWSRFGGWKDGPKLEATGFFRVEKVDGKWWFVDPEGYLFWSNGPTCMSPDFGYTGVEGREHYFEGLPEDGSELAQFYQLSNWAPHGFYSDKIPYRILQVYKANLYRKYGEDWLESFIKMAHLRLRSWGMNTVANWALPELYRGNDTAYIASFFVVGNRTLEGSEGYWGKFHDVFDPSFRESVKNGFRERRFEAQDPWCIGFFVDNELSWGNDGISLSLETLTSPADQPAKIEFGRDLRRKYRDIESLNLAWGTGYRSWTDFLETRTVPSIDRAIGDLRSFYRKTADTYFRTIREEQKAAAPNHLYMGCRFAWVNDTVALSSAEYCDVVSYNKYERSIRSMRLPYDTDRPMIIGEYHFGATDKGHFHPGLREGKDQNERAELFKDYLQSALENPQMVGVHWFQWVDEHFAGRADEENYNVGLVDIADTPYREMVEVIRSVGKRMYPFRYEYK
ncbi:MAG: beta-agarase [Verrucomicrobiota bacterium]